jgi:ligand-binding sensor domain-containing protein
MKLLRIFSFALVFYTISYCQSDQWINYFGPTQVNSLAAEGEYLWIGTDINITRMNVSSGELEFFRNKEIGLPEDPVSSIAVDNQGNKWIGKKGGGLVK